MDACNPSPGEVENAEPWSSMDSKPNGIDELQASESESVLKSKVGPGRWTKVIVSNAEDWASSLPEPIYMPGGHDILPAIPVLGRQRGKISGAD